MVVAEQMHSHAAKPACHSQSVGYRQFRMCRAKRIGRIDGTPQTAWRQKSRVWNARSRLPIAHAQPGDPMWTVMTWSDSVHDSPQVQAGKPDEPGNTACSANSVSLDFR